MDRDLHNAIKVSRAISPQTQTNSDTALVSQIIDMAGYNSAEFIIATGGLTDADATFACLLEDGNAANLSDNAAVTTAAGGLVGTVPAFTFADDDKVFKVGYNGPKRYLRLTITPTGNNSGAAPLAAVCIQAGAAKQPVA